MTTMTDSRTIQAPQKLVFRTVSEIDHFSQAVPHITEVEFLTEERSGVGTRFRETRLMKGREATTELEVAEYQPPERVRMVADSHGTVWDSVFTVHPEGDSASVLTLTMEGRPHKLLARIVNPLIAGAVKRALADDMDAVKAYCEEQAKAT
ncbi:MAG: SRPBCC family protein [Acidobacteriota bacterium]